MNAPGPSGPTESGEQSVEWSLAQTLHLEKCHLYRDSALYLVLLHFQNYFLARHLEKMIKSSLSVSVKHESCGYSVA